MSERERLMAWLEEIAEMFYPAKWERVGREPPEDTLNARRVKALLQEQEWQPIETAPRDGTLIWVFDPELFVTFQQYIAYFRWDGHLNFVFPGSSPDSVIDRAKQDKGSWNSDILSWDGPPPTPSHWRPLPYPPGPQGSRISRGSGKAA